MARKRKKTPKNPNKHKNRKEKQENIIILGTFLVFIVLVAYLFYFVNTGSSDESPVAVVNNDIITKEDLDWWYKVSILPEYRHVITRQDFLGISLIPQEVLMQEAEKENIKATEEEVEQFLGLFIIDNGLTLDEFEEHLNSRGISIKDIKKSFESRVIITKLLEKENIVFDTKDPKLFFKRDIYNIQDYINTLMNNSDIEIFLENIEKLVLKRFEKTNDEICYENKPIIRLYTMKSCNICDESNEIFETLVNDLVKDGKIEAMHWSLDTGDNLLTLKKEKGVPKEEVNLFKKYSPNNLVPAVILGCKYKHVGKLDIEDQDEFETILKTLIGS